MVENRVKPGAELGSWTVLSYAGDKKWNCRCRCGTERPVLTSALGSGRSRSCGCASGKTARVPSREGKAQHGQTGSPTWVSWVGMIQRCTDPKHRSYARYGGQGVTVCERWLVFENFLADMGERPSGLTIERNNGTLGYEPGNCRWATRTEQVRNRSNTKSYTHNGLTRPLAAWCHEQKVPYSAMQYRVLRGWTMAEALELVPRQRASRGPKAKLFSASG